MEDVGPGKDDEEGRDEEKFEAAAGGEDAVELDEEVAENGEGDGRKEEEGEAVGIVERAVAGGGDALNKVTAAERLEYEDGQDAELEGKAFGSAEVLGKAQVEVGERDVVAEELVCGGEIDDGEKIGEKSLGAQRGCSGAEKSVEWRAGKVSVKVRGGGGCVLSSIAREGEELYMQVVGRTEWRAVKRVDSRDE